MEKNKFYLYHRASNIRVLGPGLRYTIWTQGCKHNCKNCIAPDSHPLDKNGYWIDVDELYQEIEKEVIEKNIRGITISGGEPFLQIFPLKNLIKKIKEKTNLDIICFTGFLYEELLKKKDANINYILNNVDFSMKTISNYLQIAS